PSTMEAVGASAETAAKGMGDAAKATTQASASLIDNSKLWHAVNSAILSLIPGMDAFTASVTASLGSVLGFNPALQAAVTATVGLGAASLKLAGDLEVNQVAFTKMLGSVTAAQAHLNQLREFALDTPFEFP